MLSPSYRWHLPGALQSCPLHTTEGSCRAPFGLCHSWWKSSLLTHSGVPVIGNDFFFSISGFCFAAQPRSILGICKAPVWFLASFGDDLSVCLKGWWGRRTRGITQHCTPTVFHTWPPPSCMHPWWLKVHVDVRQSHYPTWEPSVSPCDSHECLPWPLKSNFLPWHVALTVNSTPPPCRLSHRLWWTPSPLSSPPPVYSSLAVRHLSFVFWSPRAPTS